MTEENSRPQHEAVDSKAGSTARLGVPRRFDVIAAPGRRALQGRMGVVRAILLVLALVTVGIVAYAQWLAFQPNPYPSATLAALNRARYEDTFASATPQPSAPPPTETSVPTDTPTPRPTNTLVPLPTSRPRSRPTATKPAPSPTLIPAPVLMAPVAGVTAFDKMVFEWAWNGPPLQENQAFDLRIWSAREEEAGGPRRGVLPPTKDTRAEVSLPAVPAIVDFGPGEYLWTVVVVEVRADGSPAVAGLWGESRKFVYH